MTAGGRGRIRVIARKGLNEYAGPTARQLVICRLLPVAVPLLFQALSLAGLHSPRIYYFVTAALLLWSARIFLETGAGLGMLMLVQMFAGLLATVVLGFYLLSTGTWLWYSGITLLIMGYMSYIFNVIGSYLPR